MGDEYGAAKVAVFAASLIASVAGMAILWKRAPQTDLAAVSGAGEGGTPVDAAVEDA